MPLRRQQLTQGGYSGELTAAVEKRFREELAKLQVQINEEKSRNVDLSQGESFGFLGFDFRRVRSRRGVWRANYTPKLNVLKARPMLVVTPSAIRGQGAEGLRELIGRGDHSAPALGTALFAGELHWNGLLPWMPLNLPDPPAKVCAPTFSLDERTST